MPHGGRDRAGERQRAECAVRAPAAVVQMDAALGRPGCRARRSSPTAPARAAGGHRRGDLAAPTGAGAHRGRARCRFQAGGAAGPPLARAGPASAPRAAARPGLPWLPTAESRMFDQLGRSVLLHGFDDDALLGSTMDPAPLDATDASIMEESGFDVVRLPIAWSLLEPERGQFSTAYLDRIASTVAMLN